MGKREESQPPPSRDRNNLLNLDQIAEFEEQDQEDTQKTQKNSLVETAFTNQKSKRQKFKSQVKHVQNTHKANHQKLNTCQQNLKKQRDARQAQMQILITDQKQLEKPLQTSSPTFNRQLKDQKSPPLKVLTSQGDENLQITLNKNWQGIPSIKNISNQLKHQGNPSQLLTLNSKEEIRVKHIEKNKQIKQSNEDMNSTIKVTASQNQWNMAKIVYSSDIYSSQLKSERRGSVNSVRNRLELLSHLGNCNEKTLKASLGSKNSKKNISNQPQKKRKISLDNNIEKRELTYESERSSVFNEHVNLQEGSNRVNIHRQYSCKPEEEKEMKSQKIFDAKCNHYVDSEEGAASSSVEKMKSFLEFNQRAANLTSINDKYFLKNQFLRCIDVRNNQIKHIPESLCNLTILWKLRLDYNLLENLPQGIGKLEKLEILTASNNQIKTLPSSLFKLKHKLSVLSLNDNKIAKIPKEIQELFKLKVLLLHNNFLSSVPFELCYLEQLHEFSLEWFLYKNPPSNRIQKEDKGIKIIKDFQKFLFLYQNLQLTSQCTFSAYLAYSHKLIEIDQIPQIQMNSKQRSIIHYICLHGHLHLLKHLMKWCNNVDINQSDQDGTSPLVLAFKNKQADVIHYLMKHPITNFNKGSQKYGYPLHIAIKNHQLKIAQKMMRPKFVVNINAKDEEGCNALHYLLSNFNSDPENCGKLMNSLLKKGIEVNLLNKQQLAPLHVAVRNFQNKALKLAIQYNQYLRKQNQTLNMKKQNSDSSGQQSIISPSTSIRQTLIPFDFNIKGKNLWSPLHISVFNNNLHAVELLLHIQKSEKIDFFCRDMEGRLPNDMCPFNSPIYKMISKRQRLIVSEASKLPFKAEKDLQNVDLQHININRYQRRKQKKEKVKTQERSKERQFLRSGYKSGLNSFKVTSRLSPSQLFFNAEESNSDSNDNIEERLISTQKIHSTERIIDFDLEDEGQQRKKKSQFEDFKAQATLTTSKTEKQLLIVNFKRLQSQTYNRDQTNSSQLSAMDQRRRIAGANGKQSPRMLVNATPLPPKQMMNSEEGNQDNMVFSDTEEDQEYDNMQFMSNHINFCTENQDDTLDEKFDSDVNSPSLINSRSGSSNSSFEYPQGLKKLSNNKLNRENLGEFYNSDPKSSFKLKPVNQVLDSNLQDQNQKVSNSNYQSQSPIVANEKMTIIDAKYKILNKDQKDQLTQSQIEQEEEDDENCCAAEEDIEAGQIGLMTNKINKFENNNVVSLIEDEYQTMGQKGALRKVVKQLIESRLRKKQCQSKSYKLVDSQLLAGNQRYREEQEIETPVNQRIFEVNDSSIIQRDEGNVFDTVDQIDDLIPQFFPEQLQQNIQTKDNIFLKEIKQNQAHYSARVSNIAVNEDNQINLIGLGQLRKLNRDCKLFDSHGSLKNFDNYNLDIFNDPNLCLSEKYKIMYKIIYKENTQNQINGNICKMLYEKIDESQGYNSLLKADLYYLMSVSKNKDHLPLLDKAITKMKIKSANLEFQIAKDQNSSGNEQASQKSKGNSTERQTIKTKNKPSIGHLQYKRKTSQVHILYETSNAYEQLMSEVLMQSKLIMDKNNDKIYYERERSKERLKTFRQQNVNGSITQRSNNLNESTLTANSINATQPFNCSNIGTHQRLFGRKDSDIASKKSIRQAPGLIAKLNKSPSQQTLPRANMPFYKSSMNQNQILIQTSEIIPMNISMKNDQKPNVSRDQDPSSLNNTLQQVISFTPKGTSGQVFLAFQKQKIENEQKEISISKFEETKEIQFTTESNENFKETFNEKLFQQNKRDNAIKLTQRNKEKVFDVKQSNLEDHITTKLLCQNNKQGLNEYLIKRSQELVNKNSFNKQSQISDCKTQALHKKKSMQKVDQLGQQSVKMHKKPIQNLDKNVMRHHSPIPNFEYQLEMKEDDGRVQKKGQSNIKSGQKSKQTRKVNDSNKQTISNAAALNQIKQGKIFNHYRNQATTNKSQQALKKSTSSVGIPHDNMFTYNV